jgi:hypothetical protein
VRTDLNSGHFSRRPRHDEPVADVLPRLNACPEGRALVFADGHLGGNVSPADTSRALERLRRKMPDNGVLDVDDAAQAALERAIRSHLQH